MIYLEPNHVAAAVVQRIKDFIGELSYKDKSVDADSVVEITDDPAKVGNEDPDYVAPPWIGVFYNMIEEAEILEDGTPSSVPNLIGVLVSSSPNYTKGSEALKEALFYSRKIQDIVIKSGENDRTYEINIADDGQPEDIRIVTLRCDSLPRQIITASANLSVVEVRFKYVEP